MFDVNALIAAARARIHKDINQRIEKSNRSLGQIKRRAREKEARK